MQDDVTSISGITEITSGDNSPLPQLAPPLIDVRGADVKDVVIHWLLLHMPSTDAINAQKSAGRSYYNAAHIAIKF